MITTAAEPARQPDVQEFLRLGDEYAFSLYPPESCYLLDVSELEQPGVSVFVSRDPDGRALGMVALVLGEGFPEVKRLFVHDDARGLGVGVALMGEVEAAARAAGAQRIVLETGPAQLAAIALYERLGYRMVPSFGQYVDDEYSVCMAKNLDGLPSR